MDVYNGVIGLLLIIFGFLILVVQYQNGSFGKGAKFTQNTVGLIGAGVTGIIFGMYFLLTAF
jgi:hypothetical protein